MTAPLDHARSYGARRFALPATVVACALLFWARLIVVSDMPRTAIADDPRSDNRAAPDAAPTEGAGRRIPDSSQASPQNWKSPPRN